MDALTLIFSIAILIMSVVVHELSHGYAAEFLGDPTPRLQGRLTLNPLKHLEIFGSLIVPIITSIVGFTFGWAKPVEWNPYNVKNKRWGEFIISAAGPASNIFIALVFGQVIRLAGQNFSSATLTIISYVIGINIILAIFNLIPIPPLDGSKIFFSLIPQKYIFIREFMEKYSILLFLFLIFFVWRFIEPILPTIFKAVVGI